MEQLQASTVAQAANLMMPSLPDGEIHTREPAVFWHPGRNKLTRRPRARWLPCCHNLRTLSLHSLRIRAIDQAMLSSQLRVEKAAAVLYAISGFRVVCAPSASMFKWSCK